MQIAFGLFILIVLTAGLLYRRKQKKAWVQEERYDESGAWVDKRAGERGTYGSLDAEMERERRDLVQQSRMNELARLVRDYAFEHYPDFHSLSDAQIKAYTAYVKNGVAMLFTAIEKLPGGQIPDSPAQPPSESAYSLALKKQILDFSYRHFPALLDLEIETIRQLDRYTGDLAAILTEKIGEIKG